VKKTVVILTLLATLWAWSAFGTPRARLTRYRTDQLSYFELGVWRGRFYACIITEYMEQRGADSLNISPGLRGPVYASDMALMPVHRLLSWLPWYFSRRQTMTADQIFVLPIWCVMAPFVVIAARHVRKVRSGCSNCGYAAHGLDVCPECGQPVDG